MLQPVAIAAKAREEGRTKLRRSGVCWDRAEGDPQGDRTGMTGQGARRAGLDQVAPPLMHAFNGRLPLKARSMVTMKNDRHSEAADDEPLNKAARNSGHKRR